jgi:hypothetical protein
MAVGNFGRWQSKSYILVTAKLAIEFVNQIAFA